MIKYLNFTESENLIRRFNPNYNKATLGAYFKNKKKILLMMNLFNGNFLGKFLYLFYFFIIKTY